MATRGFEINLDVKCPKCGKPGATMVDDSGKYGPCLKCVLKNIEKTIYENRKLSSGE